MGNVNMSAGRKPMVCTVFDFFFRSIFLCVNMRGQYKQVPQRNSIKFNL